MYTATVRIRTVKWALLALLVCAVSPQVLAVHARLPEAPEDESRASGQAVSDQVADFNRRIREFKAKLLQPTTGAAGGANAQERGRGRDERARLLEFCNRVTDAMDSEQFVQAVQIVQQAIAQTESDAIRDDLNSVLASITAAAEADQTNFVQRVRELTKSFPARLKAAHARDAADALWRDVDEVMQRVNRGNLPAAVRAEIEPEQERLRSAANIAQRYGAMLAAEESGDTSMALKIGLDLLSSYSSSGTSPPPGLEVVRARVDTTQRAYDDAMQSRFKSWSARIQAAKSADDVAAVRSEVQALMERMQNRFSDSGGGRNSAQRLYAELSQIRAWEKAIQLQAKAKYRSALHALREPRQGGMQEPLEGLFIVSSELLAQKELELQQLALQHANDIADPLFRTMADSIANADSVPALQTASDGIDQVVLRNPGGAQFDADTQPLIEELRSASLLIKSLTEMQSAMAAREWGRFWQANQSFMQRSRPESGSPPSRWFDQLNRLRTKLTRSAMVTCAELAELKIAIDEQTPLDQAMLKAADAAIAAKEFRRAAMILQTYIDVTYGGQNQFGGPTMFPPALSADASGLSLFAAAIDFESAGDFANAVSRYRALLQLNGTRVPTQQSIERLRDIGKAHPELLKSTKDPAGVPGPG